MPLNTPYILSRDMVGDGWLFRIINKDEGKALHSERGQSPVPSARFVKLWEEIIKPYATLKGG